MLAARDTLHHQISDLDAFQYSLLATVDDSHMTMGCPGDHCMHVGENRFTYVATASSIYRRAAKDTFHLTVGQW